jgi:hypothetical protein
LRRNWGWPYSACGGGFSSLPHAGIVWKAVRNAVDAIITGATQADIFGEMAPLPKEKELAVVRSMEKRVDEISSMIDCDGLEERRMYRRVALVARSGGRNG